MSQPTQNTIPELVQNDMNTLSQASPSQNTASFVNTQGARGGRGGYRGRGRGRGRGSPILCYWCRDFLPKEQANEWSHNLQLTILYMSLKLPHFAHHNVARSLTSRVQLCCIQYRMRGYGLISRANYKLVSHM